MVLMWSLTGQLVFSHVAPPLVDTQIFLGQWLALSLVTTAMSLILSGAIATFHNRKLICSPGVIVL